MMPEINFLQHTLEKYPYIFFSSRSPHKTNQIPFYRNLGLFSFFLSLKENRLEHWIGVHDFSYLGLVWP